MSVYEEKSKIFKYTAKTLTFIDFIYILTVAPYSDNILLTFILLALFPMINVPIVLLSSKHSKNYIDYALFLSIPLISLTIFVSGPNAAGWLISISVLLAAEIFVIKNIFRRVIQFLTIITVLVSNYYIGIEQYDVLVVTTTLIIFTLAISKLFSYITTLYDDILESKNQIEYIHKNTKDSIEYASIIQNALIPDDKAFKNYFSDYFIIWEPKDIVGGDIYFFEELKSKKECLLFVVDCTGHGVPGAFVTMLVKAIEKQITTDLVFEKDEISPAKILSIFNKNMKHLLKQDSKDCNSNAGFDGGVLYYNEERNIVRFAGSHTSLFYVKDEKFETIKGCRHSIGYKNSDVDYVFDEFEIETSKDMKFYISTDGFIDQNGGEKGFPLGKKKFKEMIKNNKNNDFKTQRDVFYKNLHSYQGEEERSDDITLIGLKI